MLQGLTSDENIFSDAGARFSMRVLARHSGYNDYVDLLITGWSIFLTSPTPLSSVLRMIIIAIFWVATRMVGLVRILLLV